MRRKKCGNIKNDIIFIRYESANAKRKYILVCQDLFTKKIFLRSLIRKSREEMEVNMKSIIQENNGISPMRLWTDMGKVSKTVFPLHVAIKKC